MDKVFLVFAAVTGVFVFLWMQQAKITRKIEEDRRKRENESLTGFSGPDPLATNSSTDLPSESPSPRTPDAGGHHHGGHDAGGAHGGHSGGFDGGGSDGGGGGHGGH